MYADAGVFVLSLVADERARHASASRSFLEAVVLGRRTVTTSTLTWDEVVYVVRRLLGVEDSRAKAEELLALPNVSWIPADSTVIRAASTLYRDLPIRPRDAIHAASALQSREEEILSEDEVFNRVPGLRRVWPPP